MRRFEFEDGSPHNALSERYDNFKGPALGWDKADFVRAIGVHQKAFGAARTLSLLYLCGVKSLTDIPSYAYGRIIAALADEMAQGLPHNVPRSSAAR